jgi:hypothetical protein
MKKLQANTKTFFSEHLVTLHDLYPSTSGAQKGMTELESFKEKDKPSAEEEAIWTTAEGLEKGYHAGLGQLYKYPGAPKKLKDRYKTRLWKEYFERRLSRLLCLSNDIVFVLQTMAETLQRSNSLH